jgi:Ca-activated chloride channel family protein
MSFATPLVLLGLLLLPLLAFLYFAEQRRRHAAAEAFAAPVLQPSVAPVRPRWRRHVPVAAVGLALAILIVAAAKPQRTVAVTVERASIMLATDVSSSMRATDIEPSRLAAVKTAAQRFAGEVPSRFRVGVLAFNNRPSVLQSPTRDRAAVDAALEGMRARGGTATGDAIAAATRVLRPGSREATRRVPAAILMISDGTSTSGRDPVAAARAARRLGVRVHTVVLGTNAGTITVRTSGGGTRSERVPPDPASLAEIARASGGKAYTAQTATRLEEVYESLGSQLSREDRKRQMTSVFAGGGLALLLVGMALSVRWLGRLI